MTRVQIRSTDINRTWATFDANVDARSRHACLALLERQVKTRHLSTARSYTILVWDERARTWRTYRDEKTA